MRYELMFPDQIRKAIKENWPVILPVGVLEYHGEHLAVGTDTIVVVRALETLEKEMDMVILPTFYYGSGSYAVEPPEKNGTIEIDGMVLAQFGFELFRSLLRIGFRNIHLFIHHQTDNFINGMPTDLAFKLAARKALFALQEKEHGEGWWGKEENHAFYEKQRKNQDPLINLIQVHPLISSWNMEGIEITPEHAGKLETSQMLAACPEGVDMKRLPKKCKWYCRPAGKATAEFGRALEKKILADMRKILQPH